MNKIRKYGFVAALIVLAMTAVPPNGTGGYSLTFPLLKGAFASETASDAIIQEARNEAEKLLAVRSAVWLKFLDEWNAYLTARESAPDPTALTAPVFSSFTDLDDLLDKEGAPGYLPASFPVVNYSAVSLGNEIEVTVTPSNAVSATYVPNFLPMAEVSGGTVKLRITRPGASPEFGFFVEKNAANEMGSAGTLEWVDGQGKIAVNELESNIIRSQAGGGKIDFESTVMFGTIEGRGGASISVANTLDLGSNTLKTTGDGEFGTLSVTGLARFNNTVQASGNMSVAGTLTAANVNFTGDASVTGTLGVSGMLSALGGINAGGSNINNIGALNAGSGTFTGGLSAAGGKFTVNSSTGAINTTGRVTTDSLTINGKTGAASATAYDVWVGNANNATNASNSNTLGGQTLAQVRANITATSLSGVGTWAQIKSYIDGKPSGGGPLGNYTTPNKTAYSIYNGTYTFTVPQLLSTAGVTAPTGLLGVEVRVDTGESKMCYLSEVNGGYLFYNANEYLGGLSTAVSVILKNGKSYTFHVQGYYEAKLIINRVFY